MKLSIFNESPMFVYESDSYWEWRSVRFLIFAGSILRRPCRQLHLNLDNSEKKRLSLFWICVAYRSPVTRQRPPPCYVRWRLKRKERINKLCPLFRNGRGPEGRVPRWRGPGARFGGRRRGHSTRWKGTLRISQVRVALCVTRRVCLRSMT